MNRKRMTQSISTLLLVFLLVFSLCGSVMAAGGDGSGGGGGNGSGNGSGTSTEPTTTDGTTAPGSGDGSSGGSTEPLTLVTATPANNAKEVAVDARITLEFNKNVAYATVKDGNIKAVTLWAGKDQVPANVTMADDQLQPDLRDFITVTPTEALKEGTVYTVKVDTTLSAKSGAVLAAPVEISFTTVAPVSANSSSNTILWVALGALAVVIVIVAVLVTKRKKA